MTYTPDRAAFEAFVRKELGDVPVMDGGRYVSRKIQNYWLIWQAASNTCETRGPVLSQRSAT